MRRHRAFAVALLLDLVGAAGVLVASVQTWQVVTTARPRPYADDVLRLSGRTVDAAPTALALVALAGVVALVATRGSARRVVGAVLALAGVGLIWRGVVSAAAVSAGRARSLVGEHHPTVVTDALVRPDVHVHTLWAALTIACALLIVAAGVLVALRGHRWQTMSARYDSNGSNGERAADPQRAAASLWTALDRGEDPT